MDNLFKSQLCEFNALQKQQFTQQDVNQLLAERTHFYDRALLLFWENLGLAQRQDLCLIAVGGYGRKEMFPLSDLDILILCENALDEQTHSRLNTLFNLLWDAKLQVGAAIRTLDECLAIGREELSVATNMFESRYLVGNKTLWQQLMSAIFQNDFWAISDFYQAKLAEKESRYNRYHNTGYNLEPDLKHSPGGLRDLHLLSWIMLRHYGEQHLTGLFNRGLLFSEEYQELSQAQHFLFKMRFALHLQLKRYDNRLRFDRQLQLAEQLGYQGEGNQPVEAMMRDFFQATRSISELSQLLLAQFKEEILDNWQNSLKIQPLDHHFILQNKMIFAPNRRCFKQDYRAIFELFGHLTHYPDVDIHPITLRHLRLTIRNVQQPLSNDPEIRQGFIQIFQQGKSIGKVLTLMHRLGVLSAYFPAWKEIEGLMQFDMFHLYTVDEHSLRVLLKLESFLYEESKAAHPLCSALFKQMPQRSLLYLVALLHDIGKGKNGDHAILGAEIMREFAKLHHFDEQETEFMAWLVEQHLTMSTIAQRRDIHDSNVVADFAYIVKDHTRLNALTCLTVADICATNHTLWNDWKRTLFTQLYQFTSDQLAQILDYQQIANQHKTEALELIKFALTAFQRKKLRQFWASCPEHYFLRNTAKQLVWHALGVLQKSPPVVLVSNEYARGQSEIFIHCNDQPLLFARIVQELTKRKVNICDAQIMTGEQGEVLDSFIVSDHQGKALSEIRCKQIQDSLHKILLTPNFMLTQLCHPIKHLNFNRPTKVCFLNDREGKTTFELFTLDREGLLAQISRIFSELAINLINAKITTNGEQVEDFFVITNSQNQALSKMEKAQLKEKLIAELQK